jgi:hypothetical protein
MSSVLHHVKIVAADRRDLFSRRCFASSARARKPVAQCCRASPDIADRT